MATGKDTADARSHARGNAKALCREFSETAAEIDRTGRDPAENMKRIHEAGLTRLLLPGLWRDRLIPNVVGRLAARH